jgi:hypothetical protein
MKHLLSGSAKALCGLLILVQSVQAGLVPGILAQDQQTSPGLNIVIVEGDGAVNNVKQRTAREVIVKVEDRNHKPVAGALVLFSVQGNGPGGTFLDGVESVQATSDANGVAVAHGFHPNNSPGSFQINVTAMYQGLNAAVSIRQSNIAPPPSNIGFRLSGKHMAIAGIVAAAVVVGIVFAAKGSSGSSISPGTGTVGAPK